MEAVDQKLAVEAIRAQFPVLDQSVNGKPLIYFDNAASSQTPKRVIDSIVKFYEQDHANIHRGIHTLAERSTTAYEATRKYVKTFINANDISEIVFTKGTTESINLVAQSWGNAFLEEGDEIVISHLEHHSNIVPWQLIAEQKGAKLKVIPISDRGELLLDAYEELLTSKTRILAVNYISNSLGTINPVKEMIKTAHEREIITVIDAAQAAPHVKIDVQDLDCDFLALSSHKMYGPTGVGVLYGKQELLEKVPPYQGGGEMIKDVSFEGTTFNDLPHKFEAGTPNIGDVIAFKEAVQFVEEMGYDELQHHEHELLEAATQRLEQMEGVNVIGQAENKASVLSFLVEDIHPYDIGQLLDARGIAVRTGHHCTQPLMDFFKIEGTIRASFAAYNTLEEIDFFCNSLEGIIHKFR